MQAVIDAKRRIYQTAAERLGRAERVAKDQEEFKQCLEDFRVLELEYRRLYEQLKSTALATAKWTDRNLAATRAFAALFSSSGDASAEQALSAAQRTHDILQASFSQVINMRALQSLERVLKEQFPDMKRRIIDHKNLETDVSSYARRLKTLLEKKPESDADVVRTREKYSAAEEAYTRLHDDLLREFRALERDRVSFIRPIFEAHVTLTTEFLALANAEWTEAKAGSSSNPALAADLRREMRDIVAQGVVVAPPAMASKPKWGGASRFWGKLKPRSSLPTATEAVVEEDRSRPTSVRRQEGGMPPPPPPPPVSSSSAPLMAYVGGGRVAKSFSPGCVCVAHTSYLGTDEGDLSLEIGDRVQMKEELNPGWWIGILERTGEEGLFPDTYVALAE